MNRERPHLAALARRAASARACVSYFRMQLINGLQYRVAAWAGVFTQFFWGFMEIQLYRALYADHAGAFPMALGALVSYIWLRQAFLAIFNTWTFENALFQSILDGNVAYELCRPVSLYGMWFARNAALRVSRAALRCAPIIVVAMLLPDPWGLRLPPSPAAFLAFVLSMALTLGVTVAYTLIVYFACFYTVSADGVRAVLTPVTDFLAGGIIPLPFMPNWLSGTLRMLPFGAMMNAPLRVYSGDIAGAALGQTLLLQLFWLAALATVGSALQRRGLRRLAVQGG